MTSHPTHQEPIAIIGLGSVLPDAPDVPSFWKNVCEGLDSIGEVPRQRWRPELHYDADPKAPNRSYTKIGAFITDFRFDPLRYRIPPRVAESMDEVQKWAVEASAQALADAGYDEKDFDRERCAVVIGNALAGEFHYKSTLKVYLPSFVAALRETEVYRSLSLQAQAALDAQFEKNAGVGLPEITEDTMPGELSNVIAGRVAQTFNLRGSNFTTDAACASSLAALQAAVAGLSEGRFDMVLTGGVDSSLGPQSFVKFSKIGALSASLSCPFDERADGFVMGEGCAMLLLKRLSDAERDGDKIYAVLRGIGSSSDGKGKGITAPNPHGQRLAIARAYEAAGISPAQVGLLEAHGTSTAVGDVVEANTTAEFFREAGAAPRSFAMGSVKSQIGHLKGAAGAAALLKTALCLHHKTVPGTLHFERPNPKIDFAQAPFFVPTRTQAWEADGPRVAGVSSFGFGGSNFHAVLVEHASDRDRAQVESNEDRARKEAAPEGILRLSGETASALRAGLKKALSAVPANAASVRQAERLSIAYADDKQLERKLRLSLSALDKDDPAAWRALAAQGIHRGHGPAGRVAFVFPGQGSQYINMLAALRQSEPIVAETFAEADTIMQPILGRSLSSAIFSEDSPANRRILQDTTLCQPAMLTADMALTRLFEHKGLKPDLVAGHSLGEYAALVAAGVLSLEDALLAVSARAKEMSGVKVEDPGKMAAVFMPASELIRRLTEMPGVVPANYNSPGQTVIAGPSRAMEEAVARLSAAGVKAVLLDVSHAFHSPIVAPAAEPLRRVLENFAFHSPRIPVVANIDAEFYGSGLDSRDSNIRRLAAQVASPVRWVESLHKLYATGARFFVEVGPKKVLSNFVTELFEDPSVSAVHSNHPKQADADSLRSCLAAAFAAGRELDPGENEMQTTRVPDIISPKTISLEESRPAAPAKAEIVISGVSMGLPGLDRDVFAEDNTDKMLSGYDGIQPLNETMRQDLARQRVVRLFKDAPGGPAFGVIDDPDSVAQLAGQKGRFDLVREFGVPAERAEAYDVTTQLAIGAGLLALRDAGIPLLMGTRQTSTGGQLPTGWRLPAELADETGIIFASAFPGSDQLVREMTKRGAEAGLRARLEELKAIADELGPLHRVTERIRALEEELGEGYAMQRDLIFRVLSLGHAQLAELIGARGPNIQLNAACASTTLAVNLAGDWIAQGRCRRVLVVGADDITNPVLAPWLMGGLMATGALSTEKELALAALPFDRRRNGMIPGMGAVGLVVEDADKVAERGLLPLTRLLGSEIANSAFHGTRLDSEHIAGIMERFVERMCREHGLERAGLARQLVFVSHETYTPARGGSASAEVAALRRAFGEHARHIVIANTKGFTGHPMAAGIEDAAAARMLQHQRVPPIANHREVDPELGELNLSAGGHYPVRYALRLAAGFGSQLALSLSEKRCQGENRVEDQVRNQRWLSAVSGLALPRLEVENKSLRVVGDEEDKVEAVQTEMQEPAPVAAPSLDKAQIEERILGIVAEKTGYPVDMLEPELDLEADLGIDTVKQAEMFAEIRAAFGIPRQDDMKLADYPSLAHIIQFALDRMATTKPEPEPEPPRPSGTDGAPSESQASEAGGMRFRQVQLCGLPAPQDCPPSRARLHGRVFIAGGSAAERQALARAFEARGAGTVELNESSPAAATAEALRHAQAARPDGLIILAPEGAPLALDEADQAGWQAGIDARITLHFQLCQALHEQLADREEAFFCATTRMGGRMGAGAEGPADPAAGLSSGFTKALKREWGRSLVKALDLPVQLPAEHQAAWIVEELSLDPDLVELGRDETGRWALRLQEVDLPRAPAAGLPAEPVALISGGSGGIVAQIVADLARHKGGDYYLLSRTAPPEQENEEMRQARTDRRALQAAVIQRLKREQGQVTPATVEAELQRVEKATAAFDAADLIRRAGGRAHAVAQDIRNAAALQSLCQSIRERHGRLDLVVHAAGIDHSRPLPLKTNEDFSRIVGVKADGLRNILRAIGGWKDTRLVLFGSIAGRFGNVAQTDYAGANDLLAKAALAMPRLRPELACICLDYSAWAEVGMASRGSIPQAMAEAGIGCIPLAEGAASVRQALEADLRGEWLAGCELGIMETQLKAQRIQPEGLRQRLERNRERFALLEEVAGWTLQDGLELRVSFDPRRDPYLNDHRIENTPVVPGVMAVECFAEAILLLEENAGAISVEDLSFEAPLKLYRDEARTASLRVQPRASSTGRQYEVSLETRRELAGGREQITRHYRARLRMEHPGVQPWTTAPTQSLRDVAIDKASIYRAYFHGPGFQVLEQAGDDGQTGLLGELDAARIQPQLGRPAHLHSWPMLTELAFQTAGLLEAQNVNRLGLPAGVRRLRIHPGQPNTEQPILAHVKPEHAKGEYAAVVQDGQGRVMIELDGYQTSALPWPLPAEVQAGLKHKV